MHLRRALLLFAIVLVVSALAASLSPPQREEEASEPPPGLTGQGDPPPRPGPESGVEQVRFSTRGKPERLATEAGSPARVIVEAEVPGQVELEGLGRTATAVPGTPATFDLLPTETGLHAVLFEAAAKDERERIGTLVVERGSPVR